MKLLIIVSLVVLCFTKACGNRRARTLANPLWNETVVDRLRNDLLTNYDRFARPSHHQESMNVTLGFDLYYLDTDELNSTFSVAMGVRLYWGDPKLTWNPDDYDGSRFITMAEHEIWQPDLYLLNSASSGGEAVVRYSNALAIAHSDGIVQWVTSLRFTALCDFDLYYWPHDTQRCQLKFGSWSQSSRDLQLLLDKVFYETELDSGQWNITNSFEIASTQRELYPDSFHQVVLSLTLTRKPSTMTTVISVTITTLTLLVLMQQFVVHKALIVPCLVSAGTCLCLLHFSTKVGATKNSAPWILNFFKLPKVLWNETNQDKLKKDLFVNYDKHAGPHETSSPIEVSLGVTVLHVVSNEAKSTVTFHALIKVIWHDPKLKWNKDNYDDITELRVADHEIWHPDVFLINSALGSEPVFRFGNPNAVLRENGEVQIVLRAKHTVLCRFDLRHWPFDTQHCTMEYASWVYNANIIKLLNTGGVNVDYSFPFSAWNVADSSATVVLSNHKCCFDPHYRIVYNLTLIRNPETYIAVCVTPAIVSALMILLQFWLPPGSQSKAYINGVLIATFIFHLLYFADQIGRYSLHVPHITLFYAYNLYAVTFALIIDVLGIYVTKSKKLRFLEISVERNVAHFAPALFFAHPNECDVDKKQSASERLLNDEGVKTSNYNQESYYFATFLNRVMFLFYLVTLCIAIFTFK
ncbi:hypothetical protein FQR65_LT05044 [Abscondita terminalis]|nr:hypothetical protein FQR65_LT05044 [Abscondita terminalis]